MNAEISKKDAIQRGFLFCASEKTGKIYNINEELEIGEYRVIDNQGYINEDGEPCQYFTDLYFTIS